MISQAVVFLLVLSVRVSFWATGFPLGSVLYHGRRSTSPLLFVDSSNCELRRRPILGSSGNLGREGESEQKETSSNPLPQQQGRPRTEIRFLGKGPNAIVRPGVVLVAPAHEYHHFYRQAAIFVYAMGEDDEGVYVVRGVIIDHPTPFTLAEMMDHQPQVEENPLGRNLLFRGGDKGREGVILLHDRDGFGLSQIGTSGIFQGGWDQALKACQTKESTIENFKAFFNYCEFTEDEIEDLLADMQEGDGWVSVEVEPSFVLDPEWDRGDAWKRLRNFASQQQ